MRKLLFLLLLTFTSCSIKTEFFIYDTSNELVAIEYEFLKETEFGGFVSNPEIMGSNWRSKLKKLKARN